jgi:hypothetical protein
MAKKLSNRGYNTEQEWHVFNRRLQRIESGSLIVTVDSVDIVIGLGQSLEFTGDRINISVPSEGVVHFENVYKLHNDEYFLAEDGLGAEVNLFKLDPNDQVVFLYPIAVPYIDTTQIRDNGVAWIDLDTHINLRESVKMHDVPSSSNNASGLLVYDESTKEVKVLAGSSEVSIVTEDFTKQFLLGGM